VNPSESEIPAGPRLYSISSIDIATFFGSWLAGSILISRNFTRLGNHDSGRNAILLGIASSVALVLVTLSIVVPEGAERALRHRIQAAQVAVIHLIVKRVQGAALTSHAAGGGEFFSRWRAFGVSLLVIPGALALFLGVAYLFPNLPALRE